MPISLSNKNGHFEEGVTRGLINIPFILIIAMKVIINIKIFRYALPFKLFKGRRGTLCYKFFESFKELALCRPIQGH